MPTSSPRARPWSGSTSICASASVIAPASTSAWAAVERLGTAGIDFARASGSFDGFARLVIGETRAVDPLYEQLGRGADDPAIARLAGDLYAHENALRDWLRSELDRASDGGRTIFGYLERHGVPRSEAIVPRHRREDLRGDRQRLVLAARRAVPGRRFHRRAGGRRTGRREGAQAGRQAGRTGMGVGVVLGVVAALAGGLPMLADRGGVPQVGELSEVSTEA